MIDRHLKPRGNILIFTIFVLFASALLGILVSIMMRDFLKYSNEIAQYHQANALAKSASELGFLMIWESKAGFKFEWDGKNLIASNFSCPVEKNEKEECWLPRSFSLKINGLTGQISTSLPAGQSLTLPRFYHETWNFKLAGIKPREQVPTLENTDPNLKISVVKENDWVTQILENPGSEGAEDTYYIVSNLDNNAAKNVSVSSTKEELFDGHFTMSVEGNYADKVVSKECQINQSLPDFLQSDNYLNN